jgi:triacylglycerol lipase
MRRLVSAFVLASLAACGDPEGSGLLDGDTSLDDTGGDTFDGLDDTSDADASRDASSSDTGRDDTSTDAADAEAGLDVDDASETDNSEVGADTSLDGGEELVEPEPCEDGEDLRFGPDVPSSGIAVAATFASCSDSAHTAVAPSESSWQVEASELPTGTVVRVYTARYFRDRAAGLEPTPLASSAPARAGIARALFDAPSSGEYVITLDRPVDEAIDEYAISLQCRSGCDREATRYPIVLMHGYAGVDSYFGVLDYFFDVRATLAGPGYVSYTPSVAPIATSERRAEQLEPLLEAILEETGARKLNLIAHSQGGLDARVLVSGRGWSDRVASITTVATPHGGIPLLLANFLSIQDFSPDAMEVFNETYKDAVGVEYWSWSSRSCGILEPGCRDDSDNELVDVLLGASYTLLLRFGENDGIVPTASMLWGEHLGMLFADHFDEVGQIADGERDEDPFDHRAFYLSEARRLRDAGL